MSDVVAPTTTAAPTSSTPSTSAPKAAPAAGAKAAAPTPGAPAAKAPAAGKTAAPATAMAGTPDAAEAAKTDAAKAAEAARRKYKLKVDGAERQLELSDDEVSVRLQKAEAAERRMQEAAEVRKQFKSIIDAIKENPAEALKDPVFGLDVRKMIEDQILAEYEAEQLSPQEREKAELQKQLKEYQAKEEKAKAEQQQRARQEMEKKYQAEMERDFMEAIDKGGLPKTRHTLAMMAEIAQLNLQHGIELTPAQMAAEVKAQVADRNKQVFGGLKGEALASYLGEDVVKEIIRFSVAKVKPGASPAKDFTPPTPATPNLQGDLDLDDKRPPRKLTDLKTFRKFLRND